VVSGVGDALELAQQEKLDQQQAANNARQYNADGSAKANDFRTPRMPQSAFPASLDASGQLRVNRDQLAAVKNQMGPELAKLQAAWQQLSSTGAFGGSIGGWATSDAFGGNATNAYEGITQFMQALNAAYDMVIGVLGKTAANYADAETSTASAASKIGADAAPGSALNG
jgi:uncharacterized protein YukE